MDIRAKLQSENPSTPLDFYEPPLRARWQPIEEEVKSIREGLEAILQGYVLARESEPFNSRVPIADVFNRLVELFRRSPAVAKRTSLEVVASYGKGNWASVPWISFLDNRETATTQHGTYVVFLFKEDGTGVYLTYNQGVTDIIKAQGRQKGQEQLQQLAEERRKECAWLSDRDFLLDDSISLSEDTGLGRDYEASTIAHKLYLKGAVPTDEAILKDLESVLTAYDQYVGHKILETPEPPTSPETNGHWLFQANPKYYDIRRALNDLQELTWSINQMSGKFRAGQTGYLWESGPAGGIIAHGTLLTGPTEIESDPREDKYFSGESDLGGKRLRVRLRIDQVLKEPIPRQSLLDHPTLKSLGVLRFANATNYTLSKQEYDAIRSLATKVEPILDLEAIVMAFSDALKVSFVEFGQDHLTLVRAFVSSLATKPLVILTGLSGSGKTQLALRFGEWLGGSRLHVAAVRPDWTGAEALFGYEDALKPVVNGKPAWNVPSTLAFLLRAAGDPQYPYVLVLDEMNLAHVERYFADVLSGMESKKPVLPNLVKGEGGYWRHHEDAADTIPFPQNVFVVGTVNIDETTYMFSPKVLDRANTFEFRVKTGDLSSVHRKPLVCSEGEPGLIRGFLEIATNDDWHLEAGYSKAAELGDRLRTLHSIMSKYGFEFGHRVFYEALRFAALNEAAGESSLEAILDKILMQKLLPRVHGSRRRIEALLLALCQYCFHCSRESADNRPTGEVFDPEAIDAAEATLPYSFDKLLRMLQNLRANQFTKLHGVIDMPPVVSANLPILRENRIAGSVVLSLLPNQRKQDIAAPLVEEALATPRDSESSIQLLEESEYRYEINVEGASPQWSTYRPEIFQPDTVNGRTGRLRTGPYTGWLPVTIFRDGSPAGNISLEVRSRKLNYLNEYHWMMRDLAEELAEVVMYNFAPAEQRFSMDDSRDAVTLYQRFAFVRSLIASDSFKAAIRQVIKRPHVSWEELHEVVRPGQGMKGTSVLARRMAKPGQRSPWRDGPIATIPDELDRRRTEVSLDTTPNRFVKFALTRWRQVVSQISEILQQAKRVLQGNVARVRQGKYLTSWIRFSRKSSFASWERLYQFPVDDQVLQKREGYREILRANIQFEVASKLVWSGGEDVYGAGQRDVATLYEYWVFLKLAQVISERCDAKFDFSGLIEVQKDGLNVSLRRGKAKVFTGTAVRFGRQLTIELWFNRTYSSSKLVGSETSWSEQMRPDYTLRISSIAGMTGGFEPVLLHFDAKYRLQVLEDLFDTDETGAKARDTANDLAPKETALRSDLLKMHAYRDAIRRSAGAYIIYPGTEKNPSRIS